MVTYDRSATTSLSTVDLLDGGSFSLGTDDNLNYEEDAINESVAKESWYKQTLSIVVVGASGDLAKKKTYPSLLMLFQENLLPEDAIIWGYARSAKSHQELRDHLYPHLKQSKSPEIVIQNFLEKCFYHSGKSYGDENAYRELMKHIQGFEERTPSNVYNRLFYLAIPPNVFGETGMTVKKVAMSQSGWTRLIIEKPFGRDLDSCKELLSSLAQEFEEHHLYRIDHYLGKEVVQNVMMFRFANSWLQWMWNKDAIESVMLTFKEPFGTEGRGGYFDNYGIIRDILQNHLLQVLCLVSMEPPTSSDGDAIRDAKAQVLNHMPPIILDDALLGQYIGYSDDSTIRNKDTNCPTYAALRCWVNTPRWQGVPFILEAGKALDERICEVRIRFKPTPFGATIRDKQLKANELVMQLQPNPKLEMTTIIKTPGFSAKAMNSSLTMHYDQLKEQPAVNPDAYTRLVLDVLRGRQGSFVRSDELYRSWEIFTPILHQIEQENVQPKLYKYGSTGPTEREEWMRSKGAYGCTSTSQAKDNDKMSVNNTTTEQQLFAQSSL